MTGPPTKQPGDLGGNSLHPPSPPAAPWSPVPPPSASAPHAGFRAAPPFLPPTTAPQEGRTRPLLVAAALAGALLLGLAVGVPAGLLTRGSRSVPSSAAAPSPAAVASARGLYQQALAATRASRGFHYVAVSSGGSAGQTMVGDAGASSGRQVITVDSAFGHEQFTLLLVGGTVYFQGNAAAAEDQLGVATGGAAGVVGTWVSVGRTDGPYAVLAPGITVADQAQEIALAPASTLPVRTADGAAATRIVGTSSQTGAPGGAAHLDVAAGSHLPLSEVSTSAAAGVTISLTTSFSGWGVVPEVSAPTGAVAWGTLGATQPPGGYGSGGGGLTPSPTP